MQEIAIALISFIIGVMVGRWHVNSLARHREATKEYTKNI